MKPEDLFEAIGQIAEERLEKTEADVNKLPKILTINWNKIGTLVACLCILIVGTSVIYTHMPRSKSAQNAGGTAEYTMDADEEADMAADQEEAAVAYDAETAEVPAEAAGNAAEEAGMADTAEKSIESSDHAASEAMDIYVSSDNTLYIDGDAYVDVKLMDAPEYDHLKELVLSDDTYGEFVTYISGPDGDIALYRYDGSIETMPVYVLVTEDNNYSIYTR